MLYLLAFMLGTACGVAGVLATREEAPDYPYQTDEGREIYDPND